MIIGCYLSEVFSKINALEISKDSEGRSVVEYTFSKIAGFQPAYYLKKIQHEPLTVIKHNYFF